MEFNSDLRQNVVLYNFMSFNLDLGVKITYSERKKVLAILLIVLLLCIYFSERGLLSFCYSGKYFVFIEDFN